MTKGTDAVASTATAVRWSGSLDAEGFPPDAAWEAIPAVHFDTDWRGENADPSRATQVRLMWTPETLFLEFRAQYRTISVFPDADTRGWRDHLWDRDVCEAFLQSNPSQPRHYREFEVAPNGFWIDLAIGPGEKHDLQSGLRRRVTVNEVARSWRAVLSLPMKSLVTGTFDPAVVWRANFYRVEGEAEPRFYSAWRPTGTPIANFHVPEVFGRLLFTAGH